MTERTCRQLYARDGPHRMTKQPAARLAQHRVKRERAVPLAEHEHVAVGPVWPAGVDPQHGEVQGGEDIDERQRPAQMPALFPGAHVDHAATDPVSHLAEPVGAWLGDQRPGTHWPPPARRTTMSR